MCTWGWIINTYFSAEFSLPQELSDGGGACPALWSQNARKEKGWISLKSWLKKKRNTSISCLMVWSLWMFCQSSLELTTATAVELCRRLHPGASWPARTSPSLVLWVPHSAGSREPATSDCLSSSDSFSLAMWLNLAAITPAVTQHPLSCSFSQSPLKPSPLSSIS